MQDEDSLWQRLTWTKGNALNLPTLEGVVAPRPHLMRGLLNSRLCWLVGPPKVGKTVIAHYAAFLREIGRHAGGRSSTLLSFDGGAECASAASLVVEAPYAESARAVVFENPFGSSTPRPNPAFLAGLARIRSSRPNLAVYITSRPQGYLEFAEDKSGYVTPFAVSEWYSLDALACHAERRAAEFDAVPESRLTMSRRILRDLAIPALIDDYLLHDVRPTRGADRRALRARIDSTSRHNVDDIVLDKLRVLEARSDLAALAALVRLQEFSPHLPTALELSSILGFDVSKHPHASLVATEYEFDGRTRLKFEHVSTREAAELLLFSVGLREDTIGERFQLKGLPEWLKRAEAVWRAEMMLHVKGGEGLAEIDKDLQTAIVPQMLHILEPSAGLEAVLGLKFDPWTAQDLAYELAANWTRYEASGIASRIAQHLVADRGAQGAYALLEALLYVRGQEVRQAWKFVDRCLLDLASAPGRLDDEVVLALDGLAWRGVPTWKRDGDWIEAAVDRIRPTETEGALLCFLKGYHPEGFKYFTERETYGLGEFAAGDVDCAWTDKQALLACYLVQWHFLHQSRARAQLARQPWVDQQFLCQSFHPASLDVDRDWDVSRLVSALRTSKVVDSGWGLFLAENLRAIDPAVFGPKTRAEALACLEDATEGDLGVLASAMTYAPDASLARAVRLHFRSERSRALLLDALRDGLVVLGTRIVEPRFAHRRDLPSIYSSCGIEWTELKQYLLGSDVLLEGSSVFTTDRLLAQLEATYSDESESLPTTAVAVMAQVRSGDLRVLEAAASHLSPAQDNGSTKAAYKSLLEAAAALVGYRWDSPVLRPPSTLGRGELD